MIRNFFHFGARWCALLSSGVFAVSAATVDVQISGFAFSPAQITITVGDTVRWTNRDPDEHTSTSDTGVWDSNLIPRGGSFSFTFNSAGGFSYHCTPHSFMTGTVTVQAGASTAPVVSITQPAEGARINTTNVTIEATASDSDGTISRVEFFAGANSLGVDTNTPYRVEATLSPGAHTLTAKATDSQGLTTVSAPVNITVETASSGQRIENPISQPISKGNITIELQLVADGLVAPLGMAVPDDGSNRIFVYEQNGTGWVIQEGTRLPAPLLDVRSRLVSLGIEGPGSFDERGLLGLAAHPNFKDRPLLYTYTSEPVSGPADFTTPMPAGEAFNHQSVIAEWRMDPANTNRVDPNSRREIMRIDQPQFNHNAGTLRFGADGFLYVALGDGGEADDEGSGHVPGGNAQNKENIYGKLLRIDVEGRTSPNQRYAVPADNPFVGQAGLDEIYAYGLRNPYSFSFDRQTRELYVGDVGQNAVEEISRATKGGNLGWNIKEGSFFFDPNGTNAGFVTTKAVREVPAGLIDPIAEYDHDDGLAIIGGYVYRGMNIAPLTGRYVTGDLGRFAAPTGRLFYLDETAQVRELRIGAADRPLGLWLKGFGEDAQGELYVFGSTELGPFGTGGKIFKIVPVPAVGLRITSVRLSQNQLELAWTGGMGPYLVQSKSVVTEPTWQTVMATTQSNATVPVPGAATFFRVVDMGHGPALAFTTSLSGAAERPAVSTTASGSGTLSLEGNTLGFVIRYAGLSGPAIAAHIHGPAPASESAPVLINLEPFNGGSFGVAGSLSGSVTLSVEQKAQLLSGKTYVNVHTAANSGGEIRGQIAPVLFAASLSGGAERPTPVNTAGKGSALLLLAGNQLTLNVTYSGLSGAATAAHLHGAATTDQAAGVIVDLAPLNGGAFGASGSLAGTVTLTPDHLGMLIDGLVYLNFHTVANGSGEIRGQVFPQTPPIALSASLSGAAERPDPVTTSGAGTASLSLEGNLLRFDVQYSGLSGTATAAHIHGPSSTSNAAPVLINLEPFNNGVFGTNGTFSGAVLLTDDQKNMLLQGQTYINVHTPAKPAGEIRGQVAPLLMKASLTGAGERPNPVTTTATASAQWLLIQNRLRLNAAYAGLSGPANAAHIHGPATTEQAAGVLIDLQPFNGGAFGISGAFAGTTNLSPDQLNFVIDELTYMNIHTPAHPGGEIRGQIRR